MKLLTADVCHLPVTDEITAWRAKTFDMCTARITYRVPQMKAINNSVLLFEYVQATYPTNTWTKWIRDNYPAPTLGASVGLALNAWGCDGIFLDTPFENVPMPVLAVQSVKDMKDGVGAKLVSVNFGDADMWMGNYEKTRLASAAIAEIADVHFVEAAVRMDRPFDMAKWLKLRTLAGIWADRGKKVVLGIYDPAPSRHDFACALAFAAARDGVYAYYRTKPGVPGEHPQTFEYNDLWELAS